MSIKGKVFKVIDNSWAEGLDSDGYGKNINLGDRVVALEESTVPWCVLESKFKGYLDVMKYNDDDVSLYYFENTDNRDEIVWIDEEELKKLSFKERLENAYKDKYPSTPVFGDGEKASKELQKFVSDFFEDNYEEIEYLTIFEENRDIYASFKIIWIEEGKLKYLNFCILIEKEIVFK